MDLNQLTVNSIRTLALRQIEGADSGHPGICLGAAPIMYTLFNDCMCYNPANPDFFNRDRFVLSAGHGSALYYATLHTFGYDISVEDLKNFRQFESKTPGHPEYGVTPGVDVSTGPLGQGIATAVGIALAENMLASKFNKDGFKIVDHYTYALCGDGCLQEGIENEAASFAGTNKLGKLIVIYDKNDITIEGNINTTFDEEVGKRHLALGWQVLTVEDGNDLTSLKRAIKRAKLQTEKPTLIIVKTHIGYGSPLVDSASCHGSPIKGDNLTKTIEALGFAEKEPYVLPDEVKAFGKRSARRHANCEKKWNKLLQEYSQAYPELYSEFNAWLSGVTPDLTQMPNVWQQEKADATRNCSHEILTALAGKMPCLVGGAADLAPSTKAFVKGEAYYTPENTNGKNIHFGIREHAMGAIANGMALHGGLRPYCSTFFVFSDYMRNAMRMSALMKLPVIYILSHDSIGVGEDGPTHQPIEHLSSLRLMPNINVFRPCDKRETAAGWMVALNSQLPTCLVLSRQNLPAYQGTGINAVKGGYILADSEKETPDAIIIATGSEVQVAMQSKDMLIKKGIDVRVVSMPCAELFDLQDNEYKQKVLPQSVKARVAVEAGTTAYWYKYVGLDGAVIGIDSFGISSKPNTLFEYFGITAENVAKTVEKLI